MDRLRVQAQDLIYKARVQVATWLKRPMPKDPRAASLESGTTYEINLVPTVKMEMLKAQKIRNRVLFGCIVVSSVFLGVVLILFGVKSGQDIAIHNQDKKLETLSEKLNDYSELEGLVTIQDQLAKYSLVTDQRKVVSRVFGALSVLMSVGQDSASISELRVNLETSTITMDGQVDARVAPLIDYRVLEALKKSVGMMTYDYGRYVDAYGNEIPVQCIDDASDEGIPYREGDSYYAWWNVSAEGCEAAAKGDNTNPRTGKEDDDLKYYYSEDAEVETEVRQIAIEEEEEDDTPWYMVVVEEEAEEGEEGGGDEEQSEYEEKELPVRVKIWRTPQYDNWYKEGYLTFGGSISGVEHFESACYSYAGDATDTTETGVSWSASNSCVLVPDGLNVTSSSNGRNDSNNLVLRFTAKAVFADDFFTFENKHMIAIGPMGQNVTDSYVQIGSLFSKAATACESTDLECLSASTNSGGSE